MRVVRYRAAAGLTVLEQVRDADHATAPTAEYKQVTVLFADVVRSMDIAAAVDMERLRYIQRTHESLELPRMETTRRSGSTTTHMRKDL